MSSPGGEVSVLGAGFGSEHGEQTSGLKASSRAPRGPGPGPEPGAPQSSEGEGGNGFPDPEGFESELEVLEAGGSVLWGRERRPGSLADDQGDALQLADESVAAILQQLTDLSVLNTRRYLFQESNVVGEVSAFWDFKACPPSRGGAPQRCGEAAQAGAVPLQVGGPKEGRAWGNAKRGTKSRLNVAVDHQWPPSESPARLLSNPESSDVFENAECALGDGEQPAQLPGSSSNISYCSSSTGSGLRPTPRRKGVQEKKSLGGVSKPALGRTFPSWGQRISATPLEPATFPAISGIPLLGRSKKYALVPWEAEESKHTVAGKKPVARRAQESVAVMVVSGEDNDPTSSTKLGLEWKGELVAEWI
ncbi:uncharacterized protein CXorf49 homolog [Muntiacus reevesi]|uniref:uncharacterized protein CXorf49 homolog n=1 Tax=Muntiacus reevesi TaxID=9886 RepID=UPI003306CF71